MDEARLITSDAQEAVALRASCDPADVVPSVESGRPTGSGLAPVIILNMSYSGLGIARSLRGRGLRILGLSPDRSRSGNFTRCCEVQTAPDSQEQPGELLSLMVSLAKEYEGAVVFPTRDADVLFLDRFRNELAPLFRLCVPAKSCLARTIDKRELARVARQAGVPTPNTFAVRSAAELERVQEEVGFPCVVKPIRSVDWRSGQNWTKTGCRKAFLANDAEELRREYARVSLAHPCVLLQEWIPGPIDKIVIFGAYVGENSEPRDFFTARKVLQTPDLFGTGCVVASEDIPELLEPSRTLLKALQYRGLAEIEYKQDARSGEYRLIEINTRHWDQHQLGEATGVNLTWTAYCDLTGLEATATRRPHACVKWVAEDGVILYALQMASVRPKSLRSLLRSVKGTRMYAVFAWYDPVPLLHYLAFGLSSFVAKALWKRIRRG